MSETEPQFVETQPYNAEDFDDYWSFSKKIKYVLPDGKQWIEFNVMNEGQKKDFQKKTNRDVKMNRKSQEVSLKTDVAEDRHALITSCVTGWQMRKDGNWVGFSTSALRDWLNVANPVVVEKLETEIRKANPWLMGEMTSEDIKEQIASLEEMLTEKLKEESEKNS